MEENIKIIENLLEDLRKYKKQTEGNFELLLIANTIDDAITNIEYYKEKYFTT